MRLPLWIQDGLYGLSCYARVNDIKRWAAWADDVRLGIISLWDLERVRFTSSQVAIKNTIVHNECPLHPRLEKYWIFLFIIFDIKCRHNLLESPFIYPF